MEYITMSILQKPLKYTIIMWEYTQETRYYTASTRLLYSDFSISTTDEYAKPISTHEYSRHFLARVLFQYSR